MDTMGFAVLSSICTLIYSATFSLLIWRRKSPNILRRSPKLLLISLLGNLLQILITLHQLTYTPTYIFLHHKNYKEILQTRQVCGLLGHILLVTPYLLRSYRLYFIFHLGKHWNNNNNYFAKNIHRSYQSWLLKIMTICLVVWVVLTVLIYTTDAGYYLPGSELRMSKRQLDASECFFVTTCFMEQIGFLLSFYMLRNVFDDFNMARELAWVTFFWILTPMFPFFDESDLYYRIPVIIRNLILWVRSMCIPIFLSFRSKGSMEVLTLEMIGAFDLILQSEICLKYFQEYLKNEIMMKGSFFGEEIDGFDALEVFMMIENFLVLETQEEKEHILSIMQKLGHFVEEIGFAKNLENLKNWLYLNLKDEFGKFKLSKEYNKLKRLIAKQEIFVGRIMQTSMDAGQGSNKNSTMISFT